MPCFPVELEIVHSVSNQPLTEEFDLGYSLKCVESLNYREPNLRISLNGQASAAGNSHTNPLISC